MTDQQDSFDGFCLLQEIRILDLLVASERRLRAVRQARRTQTLDEMYCNVEIGNILGINQLGHMGKRRPRLDQLDRERDD